MPKEITHWTLAEAAVQRLAHKSPLKRAIEAHKNLYLIGAVILDSPFFMQWGKKAAWIRNRAEQIHDTGQNAFAAMAPIWKTRSPLSMAATLSLCAGITTHLVADAVFHPMVCHFSGPPNHPDPDMRRRAQSRHHILETYMDLFFAGNGPFSVESATFSVFFKAIEIPRAAFLEVLSRLYAAHTPQHTVFVKQAVQMHARLQSLFRRPFIKAALAALDRLPGMHLEAIRSNFYPVRTPSPVSLFPRPIAFRHPVTGEKRRIPVPVLREEALASIHRAFSTIDDARRRGLPDPGFAMLKGPNLYTGMVGRRLADMRDFNSGVDIMSLILG